MNENVGGGIEDTYQFNSYLEISQGRLIPINGYAFDYVTKNKTTLIIKLNEPLPSVVQFYLKILTYQISFYHHKQKQYFL